MSHAVPDVSRSSSGKWGRGAAASLLIVTAFGCVLAGSAHAAKLRTAPSQRLVVLLHDHVVRAKPNANARRVEVVASRRPLTRVRTVLPVLGISGRSSWVRVRLPGRPNSHVGWISTRRTRETSTDWQIVVKVSTRRVTVYNNDRVRRRFRAVVGKSSSPTPRGVFFIEEALALSSHHAGGPFALATSARSNVFQEFEGGPGQIGIHGTDNLSGALGTAVSHGCIRLDTQAITWLARRIGAGVPLVITR